MTTKLHSNTRKSIKFLYSYGGRIVPRSSDGKLRYVGGYTRVLSVDCSITYSELMVKFNESCGSSMNLKCKLPSEDLDLLISIKSDQELRIVVEEYEIRAPEEKIRAVLFPITAAKKVSPPPSPMSCFDFPSAPKPQRVVSPSVPFRRVAPSPATYCRCMSPEIGYPVAAGKYHRVESRNPKHIRRVPQPSHSNRVVGL